MTVKRHKEYLCMDRDCNHEFDLEMPEDVVLCPECGNEDVELNFERD